VRPQTGTDAVDAILYAAHRIRTSADAALREHGLSLSGLKLLKALAGEDRSMREISQALHVSPRTVTDLIDGLEARGLVTRGPHPSDRRITLLHLTDAGRRELASANAAAETVAASAVCALDADEQHSLQALLDRVGR
jgi:DNA-binding MarR family transcriptional regulator